MACAGVDKIETEWHQVEREITCFICRNIFTDPRTLACAHTFCKQCIESRVEEANRNELDSEDEDHADYVNTASVCPLCLAPLPPDGVKTIHTDAAMNSLINIFKRREDKKRDLVEVTCGKCKKGAQQVTTWCLICRRPLCSNCTIVHSKQKGCQSHTTVVIIGLVQAQKTEQACKIHTHLMLYLYCKTCSHLACAECIVASHLEHEFDLANKEMENAKQIIAPLREMAESMQNKSTKAIKIPRKRRSIKENPPLFVGMYDFSATDLNELSFNKGDFLYIISDDDDWWFAKAKDSGQEGYIPKTFVVKYTPLEELE